MNTLRERITAKRAELSELEEAMEDRKTELVTLMRQRAHCQHQFGGEQGTGECERCGLSWYSRNAYSKTPANATS